jgi:anti-sigma factor RsiW
MTCDDRFEQISAMLDGELAAPELAELTAHIAACPDCARVLAELGGLRAALAEAVPEEPVAAGLAARIEASLQQASRPPAGQVLAFPSRRPAGRTGWLAAGAAIAAMLTLALWPHHHDESLDLGGVRDAALRTALAAAPVTTPSGPGSAPALPGYRLAAARPDVIAGHQARVLVYTQGAERITLCIWPAGHEAAHSVRQAVYRGMAIRYWNDGRTEFWAASAMPANGLAAFADAVMRQTA